MVLPPGASYMILASERYYIPTFQNHSEVYLTPQNMSSHKNQLNSIAFFFLTSLNIRFLSDTNSFPSCWIFFYWSHIIKGVKYFFPFLFIMASWGFIIKYKIKAKTNLANSWTSQMLLCFEKYYFMPLVNLSTIVRDTETVTNSEVRRLTQTAQPFWNAKNLCNVKNKQTKILLSNYFLVFRPPIQIIQSSQMDELHIHSTIQIEDKWTLFQE